MALLSPSLLTAFELQRLERIAENKRRMEEMGVLDTARDLLMTLKPPKAPVTHRSGPKAKRQKRTQPARRSRRLSGTGAEFAPIKEGEGVTYSDYEPDLDDLLADGTDVESMPSEKQERFQEVRCSSTAGRGSVYDSVAGITCHFCRQKKLCGEEDCPRCSRRNINAECIGKTECSRCHSPNGRFCRACLLIRYGQSMEDARTEMIAGTWLCPHCYEDEHPDEGWMCNSSICMKRRGYKPTGIAIYDAQQRGFPSVAHWLQAQLRKRTTPTAEPTAAAASAGADVTPSADSNAAVSDAEAAGARSGQVVSVTAASATGSKAAACKAAATSGSDNLEKVDAPKTPLRGSENVLVARAAGNTAHVTRAGVKAAGAAVATSKESGKENNAQYRSSAAEPEQKCPCAEANAGTRRSLRFRK